MSRAQTINVTNLLGYKLKQTQHALRLHMDQVLDSLELTTPQYAVLAQIELKPGISNAALARASFITAQTMHGIVSLLEERKLIERKKDPEHGRIICAKLTKQGVKVVQQAHKLISNIESSMTATISKRNTVLLEELLLECFNNLNSSRMKYNND